MLQPVGSSPSSVAMIITLYDMGASLAARQPARSATIAAAAAEAEAREQERSPASTRGAIGLPTTTTTTADRLTLDRPHASTPRDQRSGWLNRRALPIAGHARACVFARSWRMWLRSWKTHSCSRSWTVTRPTRSWIANRSRSSGWRRSTRAIPSSRPGRELVEDRRDRSARCRAEPRRPRADPSPARRLRPRRGSAGSGRAKPRRSASMM